MKSEFICKQIPWLLTKKNAGTLSSIFALNIIVPVYEYNNNQVSGSWTWKGDYTDYVITEVVGN